MVKQMFSEIPLKVRFDHIRDLSSLLQNYLNFRRLRYVMCIQYFLHVVISRIFITVLVTVLPTSLYTISFYLYELCVSVGVKLSNQIFACRILISLYSLFIKIFKIVCREVVPTRLFIVVSYFDAVCS